MKQNIWIFIAATALMLASAGRAADIGTAFTYQGSLENGSGPVTDTCDFRFGLWDAAAGGNQQGVSPQTKIGVAVTAGVFTVSDLGFGAGAIDGSARWLEIEVQCPPDVGFTLLLPRVELTPAPHAIRASKGVGPPNALEVDTATGKVGIGTTSPTEALDVVGNIHAGGTIASGSTLTLDGTSGSERISSSGSLELRTTAGRVLRLENNATSPNLIGGYSGNTVSGGAYGATIGGGGESGLVNSVTSVFGTVGGGESNQAGDNNPDPTNAPWATVGGGLSNTASSFASTVAGGRNNVASGGGATVSGGEFNTALASGDTVGGGVGNTASGAFTTVGGGTGNTALASGDTVGGGSNNAASGSQSTVGGGEINIASGLFSTVPGGRNNRAAGAGSFAAGSRAKADHNGAFVWADSTNNDFLSSGPNQFLIQASGGMGIGTASATAPRAQLDVVKSGATVAVFARTTDDGTIVSLRQGSTEEGTISVSGTTVSYNAFTGSHYAWTDEQIERGALVALTGVNRSLHDNSESERIYGIAPTTKANDSKCLGAYLGLLEPSKAAAMENPHQVMAVGNGDMWVVDSGRNIEPGQYLISSDVKGHAMLDDAERFAVGYVVARAGEGVDWGTVSEEVDASAQGSRALVLPGRKHKRISVFFESFERGSAVGVGKIVEEQQRRIDELSRRLSELEAAKGSAQ